MKNQEGLEKLFFELASESRLGILMELQVNRLRMQEIARRLNLTDTETCRQLQRLRDALMVSKQPEGTYHITNFGKLVLEFFPSLEFAFKYKKYFFDHDLSRIPYEFVNRLGELSSCEFYEGVLVSLNRIRQIVFGAEEFIWVIGDQIDSSHVPVTNEKVRRGLKFRFIMQQDLAKAVEDSENLKERKYVERISAAVLINEKEAFVALRGINGIIDYSGFYSTDEKFRKWCRDLFMYYWERAERWYPGIQIE
jgi:predicted transcriptional regulator